MKKSEAIAIIAEQLEFSRHSYNLNEFAENLINKLVDDMGFSPPTTQVFYRITNFYGDLVEQSKTIYGWENE